MNILADTSALVSVFRSKDSLHKKALRLSKRLTGHKILITNYIFAETVTVLSQEEGKVQGNLAGEYLKKNYYILRVSEAFEELAWDILKNQKSKNVSYIDCTTFALYQKAVFEKVFAFDTDFKRNKIPLVG